MTLGSHLDVPVCILSQNFQKTGTYFRITGKSSSDISRWMLQKDKLYLMVASIFCNILEFLQTYPINIYPTFKKR